MRANRERGERGTENTSSCSGPNGEGRGKYIRTKKPTETRELQAELVKGKGIWIYWDMCGPSIFSKSTGVGRGRMRDWIIDAKDLALLHAVAK